jgi:DNA-binding transcriptional regulator YhcF (GntR family)
MSEDRRQLASTVPAMAVDSDSERSMPRWINDLDPTPLSLQLAQGIAGAIEAGEPGFGYGDSLPSMVDLAKGEGVSQTTVSAALRLLAGSGAIVTLPRRGVRVVYKGGPISLDRRPGDEFTEGFVADRARGGRGVSGAPESKSGSRQSPAQRRRTQRESRPGPDGGGSQIR